MHALKLHHRSKERKKKKERESGCGSKEGKKAGKEAGRQGERKKDEWMKKRRDLPFSLTELYSTLLLSEY